MREQDFDYFYREQIPDQDGITAYQDNRALLLDKVLRDHDQLEQAFGQSLARHPECPGFAVQSYDRYGDPQEILIVDATFLEGHLKIAESLMKDLWVTGERGAAIVQEVVFDDRPIASLRIMEIIPYNRANLEHVLCRQVNRSRPNTLRDRGSHGRDASQTSPAF